MHHCNSTLSKRFFITLNASCALRKDYAIVSTLSPLLLPQIKEIEILLSQCSYHPSTELSLHLVSGDSIGTTEAMLTAISRVTFAAK